MCSASKTCDYLVYVYIILSSASVNVYHVTSCILNIDSVVISDRSDNKFRYMISYTFAIHTLMFSMTTPC